MLGFVNRWVVPVGLLGLVAALGARAAWAPDRPVAAPPLEPPKVTRAPKAAADAPEAEGPAEDLPTMPVGTSDLPEQLDRRQLEAGMNKVKPHVFRCRELEQFVGYIKVRLVIARSGNVQSVHVVEPPERTRTTECVAKAVRTASFPRFRGTLIPTVELTYPFLFTAAE